MAIYFPKHKIALDIIDDPCYRPKHADDDSWTVVKTTMAEMQSAQGCRQVMGEVADLIHSPAPQGPQWNEQTRRLSRALLARCA